MNVTPDGHRYLSIANGQRIARPFHLRWLVPWICGTEAQRWKWCAQLSTIGIALTAVWWTELHGFDWRYQIAAPFLVIGLAGVWRFNRTYPVLVDAPALLCALLAACMYSQHWYIPAVVLALVAGMCKETAPVFAAAWSGPLLLVGLLAPAVRLFWKSGDDVLDERNAWILAHPVRAAREFHAGHGRDWRLLVAPWGVLLVALYQPGPRLALVLVLAYGQLLVATDSVRLYQWAFPTVMVGALGTIPPAWLAIAVVLHLLNPWAGDGC